MKYIGRPYHVVSTAILCCALLVCAVAAQAQTGPAFPAKPIRVIVPLAAGGPGDVLARAVAQKLAEQIGQPVVIDNRAGANTNVGTEFVARAPPDGYTLLATASPFTVNPALYPTLPYDPLRDFAPISLIGLTPLILVVHPSLPVKTTQELIALARSRPGQLHYGSAGNGSALHLAGEMLNTLASIKLVHVPYKGVTHAFSDLLGGQISIMFPGAPIALPQVQAGKLRALGTTGAKRTPAAPALAPIHEAGLPGYEVSVWYGMLAPAGTPAAAITRLHAAVSRIVQLADIKERWAQLGVEPAHATPAEFAAFLNADAVKWAKVVKASGAKID